LLPTEEISEARKRRIPAGRFGTPKSSPSSRPTGLACVRLDPRRDRSTFDGGEWLRGAGEFNDLLDLPPAHSSVA
jgi:hypothetical protein